MSPTNKNIIQSRALVTARSNLPTETEPKNFRKWRRTRGDGNLVSVSWSAPGVWRSKRKNHDDYYWCADRTKAGKEALEKGYEPKRVRLHGTIKEMEEAAARCQKEIELFNNNGIPVIGNIYYTGTIGSLIKLYLNSEESGFFELKYNVARNYARSLKMIDKAHGRRRVRDLTRKDLFLMHKGFLYSASDLKKGESPHLSMATKAMNLLRMLFKFGVGRDDDCERLSKILSTMRFAKPASRRDYLTADQVKAIIKKANDLGFHSIALAQAIQFETALRQKDVIGEWWPEKVRRTDGARPLVETWTSGLVWNTHISLDLIMVKPTSKSRFEKIAMADLKLCPLVMAEFARIGIEQRSGPVIVDERRGEPYTEGTFRTRWRQIANQCEIPTTTYNMDSRASAVTEGSESGVDIELLRQFATHSKKAMTQHYNRETLVKARKVHRSRNAYREAPDEGRFDHRPIIDMDAEGTEQ